MRSFVFWCAISSAAAQTTPRLEFEVASVKPSAVKPDDAPRLSREGRLKVGPQIKGDRAEYTCMSLRQLVAEAFQIQGDMLKWPETLTGETFDIVAKMPPGSRKEDAPPMLQALLGDRFKLAVHREPREEPVVALMVAKEGAKLKESADVAPDSVPDVIKPKPKMDSSNTIAGVRGSMPVRFTVDPANKSVHLEANKMSMPELARTLTRFDVGNGRLVIDMTGLKGVYDIALDVPMPDAQDHPADAVSDPGSARTLQSLKSLGLELKKTKATVDYLVVDHAERKPTEN